MDWQVICIDKQKSNQNHQKQIFAKAIFGLYSSKIVCPYFTLGMIGERNSCGLAFQFAFTHEKNTTNGPDYSDDARLAGLEKTGWRHTSEPLHRKQSDENKTSFFWRNILA